MNNQKQQEVGEQRIFAEFAKAVPLPISIGSIVNQAPPQPDVLCCLDDGTRIAFELTEAVDPNQARTLNLSKSVKQQMREYYDLMAEGERINFDRLYGNAALFFKFGADLTRTQIVRSLPGIFHFLLNLQEGAENDVATTLPDFPFVCERIRVRRGCFLGPTFDTSNEMYISTGVPEAMENKFKKRYSSSCPVELIIHSGTRPLPPRHYGSPKARNM